MWTVVATTSEAVAMRDPFLYAKFHDGLQLVAGNQEQEADKRGLVVISAIL